MAFVDLKWQKARKTEFWIFLKIPIHIWETVYCTEKNRKTKNAERQKFCSSVKRYARQREREKRISTPSLTI